MSAPVRLLLVEDDPADAELIGATLRGEGIESELVRVETREALFTALSDGGFDLILSDYRLPTFDGLGALALAKELAPDLPFIFVSGLLGEEVLIEALKAGATDYVLKERLSRLGPAVKRALSDMTEKKRAEEELRRQREALFQAEKLAVMGTLLAGVAHELNNPLSVVLGQSALLRRAVGEGPLLARLDKIVQAAERCARIVSNFLALARQRPPAREGVCFNQVVRDALELLSYPLRVDNVDLVVELADDLPLVWADPHQLHQVVINLVTNAHQALRSTENARRRLILRTSTSPKRHRVLLEVADTGPGITAEVASRIFDPFFTTKPPGQGTGLGLPLCQGIVESHHGRISMESEPGQGALFRVELPVEVRSVPERKAEREERAPIHGKRILVVDDEAAVAEVLAEMLREDTQDVDVAPNGVVALEKLEQASYDLVLSDIRMPELDGPGLYGEVEKARPEMLRRFIFLTGDSLSPETAAFLERTQVRSLAKPFRFAEVQAVVQKALGDLD